MTTAEAFDRGAARYDLMVALNPGYHRELRRAAAALVERTEICRRRGSPSVIDLPSIDIPSNDLSFIDLACGSGASTRALVDAAPPRTAVLGLDASPGMLAQATAKDWPAEVRFDRAVAGTLDVDVIGRGRHDGVLTCYLFRNVAADQRDLAVRETYDLLRPGGWLVVQEYSVAGNPRARRVWDAVCLGVIIPLGILVDRNRDLYRYLWRSVLNFDPVDRFAERLLAAGFTDVAHRTATGWQRGVLHTFVARKPDRST